jgi:uncharacterized damage-inducible protein DinB
MLAAHLKEVAMDFQKELEREFELEAAKTRKVLSAIPADADLGYKPHPKSMSLGRLAAHTAETAGDWAVKMLVEDELIWSMEGFKPWVPRTTAEILERFDKELAAAKSALAAMTEAKWESHWKMGDGKVTWIDETKYRVFREWVLDHLIHHRAQLGVYLRLLNLPVPGTFGPSADES